MSNDCGIPLNADLELKAKDGAAALELKDTSVKMAAFLKFQNQTFGLSSKDFWDVSARVMELHKCDLPKFEIHDGGTSNGTGSELESKNDFHRHRSAGQKIESLDKNIIKLADQLKGKAEAVRSVGEHISAQSSSSELEGLLPKTSFNDMAGGYQSTAADQALSRKLQLIDRAMNN